MCELHPISAEVGEGIEETIYGNSEKLGKVMLHAENQ
jgi:hypothetical protein